MANSTENDGFREVEPDNESICRILPQGDRWLLEHDGQSLAYPTRTAALEAVVLAALDALRSVEVVKIHVEPRPCRNESKGGDCGTKS